MLLPLKLSMSMSPKDDKVMFEFEVVFAEVEKILFPMSLMGATIQDSGTRARRDDLFTF